MCGCFLCSSETWRQAWSSTPWIRCFPPSVWWCWWPTGCVTNWETLSLASSSLSITTPTQWLSASARWVRNSPTQTECFGGLFSLRLWAERGCSDHIRLFHLLQVLVSLLFLNLLHAVGLVRLKPFSRSLGEKVLVPAIALSTHDVLVTWAKASSLDSGLYPQTLLLLPSATVAFSYCLKVPSLPSVHISVLIAILSGTSFVLTGKRGGLRCFCISCEAS